VLKNAVSSQTVKTNAYRRLLLDLLESDDDLALMNLSLLKEKPGLYRRPLESEIINSHEEVTVMVESYLMDYNTLSTKLEYLRSQIQNAEELMSFRLDTARNELLIVDMTLATISLTFSIANFVVGIFGMNLFSGLEDVTIWFFWGLVLALVVMISLMSQWLLSYFKLTGTHPILSQKDHLVSL
jgi:Mg2+ and Co2+ transporter CorA